MSFIFFRIYNYPSSMRLTFFAALIVFTIPSQLFAQTIVAVPFNQLEASQYNIGMNGVAWSQSSTLSNFFKLYTTGWLNGNVNTNKPWNYYGPGAEGILNYASNNAPPTIYGVNGFDASTNVQHLLDNHHRVSGLYLLTTIFTNGYSATVTVTNASGTVITTNIGAAPDYTFVTQTADWSSMSPSAFWSNMLAGTGNTNFAPVSTNANGFWSTTNQPTFLWAYNRGVAQIPTSIPPPMMPNLTDDTLRDVAAQVNYPRDYGFTLVGYQNRDDAEQFDIQGNDGPGLVLYYQEFWWANYLRPYVYLIPTASNIPTAGMDSNAPFQFTDYAQLIAFSADFLCHSSNASSLPGYYDPGLSSVDFPSFRPGSSVLIGPGGNLDVSGNMIVDNGGTLTVKGTLSVTNETFYIGKGTADNSMIISNGGSVTGDNTVIGSEAGATNNRVVVTGVGSLWTNSGSLSVGFAGSGNSMLISNGGKVYNAGGYIGHEASAVGNLVTVTGSNSSWINSGDLYVGFAGQSNRLVISNGGYVSNVNGFDDGISPADAFNSVLVTGSGSKWQNSGNLTFGLAGHDNSLVISNGGIVTVGGLSIIGDLSTATNNSVLVTGNNSLLSNSGTITIGNMGSGTLTVANGGMLVASQIRIGQYGDLDFGRYQQNDLAGTVLTPEIIFTGINSDDYGINFNQVDTLRLTSSISGAGWVCALGTGTTVMNGNNSYSLYTKIDAGTLVAASTNALGTGYVGIGGYADRATLMLATNLTVGDFIWGSNGVVALTAGSQTLTVAGMTNSAGAADGANAFQFLEHALNNNTNTLINFTSQSGFTTNSLSVLGISGYSFSTNGNRISAYISTSANVGVSTAITINGTLTVNSLTVNPSGTLQGTGTLFLTGGNLTINGTLAPGNSPGTFYVSGGNLVMGASSVWDEQIYSSTSYDRVVVTGSAILNGTLNITSFGNGGIQFGQNLNFLTASGGISGAFSSIVAPEGFRARLLVSSTQANILIAPTSYTQLAANRNQSNVATALNSFIPFTRGDQQVVSTSLDSLTASQYAQAFNAIMPTFYQQIATIAFNNANAQNMQLNQRLWGLRVAEGGGFSMSGLADNVAMIQEGQGDGKGVLDSKKDILRPGIDNHWGMFVDGNGIFAQANSGNMLPGYNSQSGGVTTGLTYKWNDSMASGIYAGYQGTYTKSGANGSGLGTGSSLIDNAVRFGVFGTYGQKDGKGLYANALAGGAYHNLRANRVIQFTGLNRTANSSLGAGELDTMLATGYDLQKGKFTYGPTASLQYTYLGVNSVNETGAQSLNFNSGGWNSSSMLSSVGAHAAYNWQAGRNILLVPQVSLNWQHEFMQNPYAISGNLGGTSPTFANWSAAPIRDFLYTGVGFTMEFGKRWNTSFFYNAAAGNSDLVSQNIFWSAGVKF
jgi:T5SS/PEP-CTERM-associated repeat protein/autotransporter-associated beta strand protein